MTKQPSDKELIDYLEEQEGIGLISDDCGRWAVSVQGIQTLPDTEEAKDIDTTFFIRKNQWCRNIREAIITYMEENS